MHPYIVRAARTLLAAAAVTLAACGDKEVGSGKLDGISEGMDRDAAIAVMGEGPLSASGADTARVEHGFRRMQYFIGGKQFEIFFYREALGSVTDPVEQALETPVVLADNKVLGTGWQFYVDAMKQYGLPTPLVEKAVAKVPAADSTAPTTDSGPSFIPAPSPTTDTNRTRM